MRAIFYCVTLSFFLIFHATHRFPVSSASPLPLAFPGIGYRTSGDVLASDSQQDFLVDGRRKQHVGGHRDVASTVDLNSPTVNVPFDAGSTVNEPTAVFHLEEYPYPTNTPQRSRTKPRRHSSTRVDDVVAVSSTSIVSGTRRFSHSIRGCSLMFVCVSSACDSHLRSHAIIYFSPARRNTYTYSSPL